MTASALIDLLKKLPPDTWISIFDLQTGDRYQIDWHDPVDHWDSNNADINLMAITEEIK